MNHLRKRLAVLALPVIAAMSLGVPASAAPNTDTRVVVAEASDTGSASDARSAVTPQALVSYISNENSIGIGVTRIDRGQNYDAILQPHRRTDQSPLNWDRAQAFYIGAGYCADAWFFQGSGWHPSPTAQDVRGPAVVRTQQSIPGQAVARWAVRDVKGC
ncbi:hypothetical protein ACFPH6_08705 [Streptomyces xiangluensis]|uniref:Secreted protein n=1 Tax=Streptomyces xiangluensis TaxID=2665720 RepID=A0ABV8YIN8_9ACTN